MVAGPTSTITELKVKKHFITNHSVNEWLLHPVASSVAA